MFKPAEDDREYTPQEVANALAETLSEVLACPVHKRGALCAIAAAFAEFLSTCDAEHQALNVAELVKLANAMRAEAKGVVTAVQITLHIPKDAPAEPRDPRTLN